MHGVVLRGDISEGADHDPAPGVGVLGMVEVDGHPQPVPVAVVHWNGEGAVRLVEQFRKCLLDLPVGGGIGVCRRPPRVLGLIRQAVCAVPEDVGERRVDLDDRAVLVADEEGLLQRVDQGRAPARVMVAQPRQFDDAAHAREEFGGRERLDEIVVGAGLQAFDGGFLPGACGQQQHGHGRGAGIGPQRGNQGQSVQPGHHHVADHEVGHSGADGLQRVLAIGDRLDLVAGAAQAGGPGIRACRRCRRR